MKSIVIAAVLAVGMVGAGAASAAGEADLAQKSGCAMCHAQDTKKMGPSYKDIAAKYKGKGDAEAKLVNALNSGTGHQKSKASPEENVVLVKWILGM